MNLCMSHLPSQREFNPYWMGLHIATETVYGQHMTTLLCEKAINVSL